MQFGEIMKKFGFLISFPPLGTDVEISKDFCHLYLPRKSH